MEDKKGDIEVGDEVTLKIDGKRYIDSDEVQELFDGIAKLRDNGYIFVDDLEKISEER